jgi:hypothetical protein
LDRFTCSATDQKAHQVRRLQKQDVVFFGFHAGLFGESEYGKKTEARFAGYTQAVFAERAAMEALLGRVKYHFGVMERSLTDPLRADAALNAKLGSIAAQSLAEAERAIKLAAQEIVAADQLSYPSEQYYKTFTEVIDAQFGMNTVAMSALDAKLRGRVADLQEPQWLVIASVGVVALLAAFLGLVITRSITRPLAQAWKPPTGCPKEISRFRSTRPLRTRRGNSCGRCS